MRNRCCDLIDEIAVFKLSHSLLSHISVLANRTHAFAVVAQKCFAAAKHTLQPLTLAMSGRVKYYYNNHNLTKLEGNHTHTKQAGMC
jgi:hypothetical protein